MDILINYKDQKAMAEDIDNRTSINGLKFVVLNMLLPQFRFPRSPDYKDFSVEIDHPDKDTNEFLTKGVNKILHNLYW